MAGQVRRYATVVTAGVLAAILPACAQGGSGSGSAKDVTIRVATADRITSVDPVGATDPGSRTLVANVFQTLLMMVPDKTAPVPDAADCQFDTPTVYTCTLRTGMTFHNGHALRASDVRFSVERLRRIERAQGTAPLFPSLRRVEVPDEFTVSFVLERPDATFPYLLTTAAASMVDEETFPPAGRHRAGTGATAVAGSGPYRIADHKPDRQVTLDRFTGYKGARPPRNHRVVVDHHSRSEDVVRALRSGAADVAVGGLTGADLRRLRADQAVTVAAADSAEVRFWAFGMLGSPAARRLAVRRAVALLVDREALADRGYAGGVAPLYSVVPAGIVGHRDAFREAYPGPDRVGATELLRSAGATTPVPLRVGFTPARFGSGSAAEAAELKRQLESSGLFRVTLVPTAWSGYAARIRAGAYDLYHYGWSPGVPDADAYLSPLLRDGGPLNPGYRSAQVTRLLDLQAGAQSLSDREAALGEIQELVAADVPVLPAWQGRVLAAARAGVDGAEDGLGVHPGFRFSRLTR